MKIRVRGDGSEKEKKFNLVIISSIYVDVF